MNINFYDGILASTGTSGEAIDGHGGNINSTPANYKVGYFDNMKEAYLISNTIVATNDTTGATYTSLSSAISAASAEDKISLQSDVKQSSALSITKNLNLCLNYSTISATSTNYAINNSATLTLTGKPYYNGDTREHEVNITASGNHTIYNTGTLNVEDKAIIECTSTSTSHYAIRNNSSSAIINMSKYVDIIATYGGIYMNSGTLNISNDVDITAGTYGINLRSDAKLNVLTSRYGTFNIKTTSTSTNSYGIYIAAATAVIEGDMRISSVSGYGIYLTNSSSSKLTLGVKDDTYNNKPDINGGYYGLCSAGTKTTINFYDGEISGKEGAINDTSYIDNIPTGYKITSGTYTHGTKVVYLSAST